MNQSGFIVALILAGFILWLAARNRLSAYTAVLWGPTAAPVPEVQQNNSALSPSSGGGGFYNPLTGSGSSSDSSGNQVAQLAPLAIAAFA